MSDEIKIKIKYIKQVLFNLTKILFKKN